jgi:hypothetical protein
MTTSTPTDKCQHCQHELTDQFCSHCGHPKALNRINGKYILAEISSILNFDRGILFTIRELLIRPGENIQRFVLTDRNRLVKPIVFIIITSLIYTLTQQFLHFEDGYINHTMDDGSALNIIFKWISTHYGYSNILMAIFIALWIKLFFRKYGYNFFEILILLCYTMGMGMLIFAVIGAFQGITDLKLFDKAFFVGIVYISWAIGQFFEKGKKINYLKSFISYFLGMLTFSVVAMLLGLGIDWLNKLG